MDSRAFPSTRYLGAKTRLLPALAGVFRGLSFGSCLDAFGGTGAVSYVLKQLGKAVTYNDVLRFNCDIARALIENNEAQFSPDEAALLPEPRPGMRYQSTVATHFKDLYFTPQENEQIDRAIQNAAQFPGYQADLARFALYQASLAKRPFNLFHRANLSLRLAEVKRSFGNKSSWDRPLSEHLRRFAHEANRAVFTGEKPCSVRCGDALDAPDSFDLVYADPPYLPSRGAGVDYRSFYHFLEGLSDYEHWEPQIDHARKHRPLKAQPSPWSNLQHTKTLLGELSTRYRRSLLVVSYRADGALRPEEIAALLRGNRPSVEIRELGRLPYALSTTKQSRELLFIASPEPATKAARTPQRKTKTNR